MRRLITNLVNNAVNYAGVGIGIQTRPQGKTGVIISVIDGGPGIDESQLGELLRPFVRGMQPDNRHPGSGLGLTIASRIARIHGGKLSVQNRPEGGLEARINMPIRNEQG
jgi:two-component system osmolarity sensor histidine kinase EnvZ